MQMCTPPKQSSKPTSIFSPDWDDTEPTPIVNLMPKRPPSNTSSIFNTKPKTDSPKKEKHRSETPHKKEKRSNEQQPTTPTSQKQRPPGTGDSKKVKNPLNPQVALPQQLQINQDIKPVGLSQKRSFSSSQDQIKQEDGVDFRELKVRKLDSDLFGPDLLENMFDVKPTKQLPPQLFNTNSNSNSQFDQFDAFNSIKESKPIMKPFSGSQLVNGIETNPDYVKSLLQESLSSNDMKFTSTSLNTLNTLTPMTPLGSMHSFPNLGSTKKMHDISSGYGSIGQIPSELPETILEPSVLPIVEAVVSEESEHHHRNKSKKKKDKHKHKDRSKDKEERSKDKEERKKHKKDKERKEREKEDPGPLKIIFSKGDAEATGPFKIKIPKDSIRADLNAPQSSQTPPSSLKIKISKDKFENYGNKFYNNNNDSIPSASGSVGNVSSMPPSLPDATLLVHKKKDREKERKDRDKSKGKHNNSMSEINKANGGAAGVPQMFNNPTQNLINHQRQLQTSSTTQQLIGFTQPQMSTNLPNPNKVSVM